MFNLSKLDAVIVFLVVFIVFPVICFLQGSPGDTSSDPEMAGFAANLFYRPIVGGDEAWWDYCSNLLFTQNPFDIHPASIFLGYVNLGELSAYSSLYILYLYVLKVIFRNPYLVIAVKGLIDLGFILWIYRNSCVDFVRTRRIESKIVSIISFLILLSPFFWWWAFSYQRDDILVVLSCYLVLLFTKMTVGIISSRRYCLSLLVLCILFLNIKLYATVLPFSLLAIHLIRPRALYLLSMSKIFLFIFLIAGSSFFFSYFISHLKDYVTFIELVFKAATSFFKPLPLNVLTIPMGEASPLTAVYLFNWFVVFSIFLFISIIIIIRPSGFAQIIYNLFPFIFADLAYRLILASYDGNILGVRQCMTALPFDLYVSLYFVDKYLISVGRFNPVKFFTTARSF